MPICAWTHTPPIYTLHVQWTNALFPRFEKQFGTLCMILFLFLLGKKEHCNKDHISFQILEVRTTGRFDASWTSNRIVCYPSQWSCIILHSFHSPFRNFYIFYADHLLDWSVIISVYNSIVGGLLIIAGLYLVTWASYREKQVTGGIPHAIRSSEPLIPRESPINKIPYQIGSIFSGSSSSLPKIVDWLELWLRGYFGSFF